MAFPPNDPNSPLGLVRMLSRDKDPDPENQVNSDEELTVLFSLFGLTNYFMVASQAVRLMAGDAAKEAQIQKFGSFTIGPGKTLYNALSEYADSLEQRATMDQLPIVTEMHTLRESNVTIYDNTSPVPEQRSGYLWGDTDEAHRW